MANYREKLQKARNDIKSTITKEQAEKELAEAQKLNLQLQKQTEADEIQRKKTQLQQEFDTYVNRKLQSLCSAIAKEIGLQIELRLETIYLGQFYESIEIGEPPYSCKPGAHLEFANPKKKFDFTFGWDYERFRQDDYWNFIRYLIGVKVTANRTKDGFEIGVSGGKRHYKAFSFPFGAIIGWATDDVEQAIINALAESLERSEKIIIQEVPYADKSRKKELHWVYPDQIDSP